MFDLLNQYLIRPPIYTAGESSFWVDEHISKKLLETHLDPEDELASRKPAFMKKSVRWIAEAMPPSTYPNLLDVGCGPGLYAQKFAKAGYTVTGIDFSRRSIEYARDAANKQGLPITYLHKNYLEWEEQNTYDAAAMIYCDYGALSTSNRKQLMGKVYGCLRPGGRFLLDVCSIKMYSEFEENKTWEMQEDGGFWSAEKYICLSANQKYEDYTTLNQYAVMTQKETKVYYIWNHCFTKDSLLDEAAGAGFKPIGFYNDVTGEPYTDDSRTIAVLLEKINP